MGNYLVIICVAGIMLFGLIRGVNVFEAFLEGAGDGLKTAVGIIPSLTALTLCVSAVRASGAVEALGQAAAPFIATLGIPTETLPLMLIRPISGSGALSVLNGILDSCGPDSTAGKIASVMMGSTETTFYTITVYFGSVGIRKTGCTIPAALTADLTGMIIAALTVNLFF
ncbi:MAG: spore maturation protein [Clostridia bacterium]|nr:spore maturation protein [Clostridia bacterium]